LDRIVEKNPIIEHLTNENVNAKAIMDRVNALEDRLLQDPTLRIVKNIPQHQMDAKQQKLAAREAASAKPKKE